MSMDESITNFRISTTHVRESTQATSQRMDRVQQQVTSIYSDLEEPIERVVHEVKTELKAEFATMLNKRWYC